MNQGSYKFALPSYPLDGLTILDVGCQDGDAFSHPMFAHAKALFGLDVDWQAIRDGQRRYPHLKLVVSSAESSPLHSSLFDVVMSRVSLPYTHIPTSLAEIHRSMKPGGRLYISMHDLRLQMEWLRDAFKHRAWKRIADQAYVFPASWLYNLTGICLPRPWNRQYETFQTEQRMRKELERAGFINVTSQRIGHHWVLEALKPECFRYAAQ
jgi:SAM-dependent methyltransferase